MGVLAADYLRSTYSPCNLVPNDFWKLPLFAFKTPLDERSLRTQSASIALDGLTSFGQNKSPSQILLKKRPEGGDVDTDMDGEVDIDRDNYFSCFKGASKSV